ncbi:hypothetical protein [Acrocarpospora macrocephala]|uniref:hypothetical protein n=1 Tax=Acrocarpospora macrocephala TaxID=150177 RepID=UPI0012D36DA6|nr:hypothetical protein [Acrocarpospora macrocephala]
MLVLRSRKLADRLPGDLLLRAKAWPGPGEQSSLIRPRSSCGWLGEPGFQVGDHLGEQTGVVAPDHLRADLVDAGDLRDVFASRLYDSVQIDLCPDQG